MAPMSVMPEFAYRGKYLKDKMEQNELLSSATDLQQQQVYN
jgi:hypothetical protein